MQYPLKTQLWCFQSCIDDLCNKLLKGALFNQIMQSLKIPLVMHVYDIRVEMPPTTKLILQRQHNKTTYQEVANKSKILKRKRGSKTKK